MKQKVWVINDQEWNRKTTSGAIDLPPLKPTGGETRSSPAAPRKSPAVSFNLAMLCWGGGYFYLGRYRAGTVCLAAMAVFYGAASSLAICPDALARLAATSGWPAAFFIAATMILFLTGMVLWLATAVDTYYRTVRLGGEPFLGVETETWPLLSSLVVPGWGQFLNGQPKKGLVVFLLALPGIFSLFLVLLARGAWLLLQAGPIRLFIEAGIAAGLATIPLLLLVWIVAAYDAFRSGRMLYLRRLSLKKEGFRPGGEGILWSLVPRGSAILGLLLAISLGMQFIPRQFYLESLVRLRGEMLECHMKIIPGLVEKTIKMIGRHG